MLMLTYKMNGFVVLYVTFEVCLNDPCRLHLCAQHPQNAGAIKVYYSDARWVIIKC